MCNVHNPCLSSTSHWTDERAYDLAVSMKRTLDQCKSNNFLSTNTNQLHYMQHVSKAYSIKTCPKPEKTEKLLIEKTDFDNTEPNNIIRCAICVKIGKPSLYITFNKGFDYSKDFSQLIIPS